MSKNQLIIILIFIVIAVFALNNTFKRANNEVPQTSANTFQEAKMNNPEDYHSKDELNEVNKNSDTLDVYTQQKKELNEKRLQEEQRILDQNLSNNQDTNKNTSNQTSVKPVFKLQYHLSTSNQQFYNQQSLSNLGSPIKVNQPLPFSGKTKAEIYKIRKYYVASSIFANPNYEPSDEVFGQIGDGKPWVGTDVCYEKGTNHSTITGPSEESRFINNPTMLVAIEFPYGFTKRPQNENWCTQKDHILMPTQIYYSSQKKEITVVYNLLPFSTKRDSTTYSFNGVNARDFGYKYAYVDLNKSAYKPDFIEQSNLGNDVYEFENYIHVGESCHVEGGCNNGSPHMPFANFKNDNTDYSKRYRDIQIKLWKERPSSPEDKPDITERIILNWS